MKYTHNRTTELFDTMEEAAEDVVELLDIMDYAEAVSEKVSISDILEKLFNRRSNNEFAHWLEDIALQAEGELVHDAISGAIEEDGFVKFIPLDEEGKEGGEEW